MITSGIMNHGEGLANPQAVQLLTYELGARHLEMIVQSRSCPQNLRITRGAKKRTWHGSARSWKCLYIILERRGLLLRVTSRHNHILVVALTLADHHLGSRACNPNLAASGEISPLSAPSKILAAFLSKSAIAS
jgi:hypothetical protein